MWVLKLSSVKCLARTAAGHTYSTPSSYCSVLGGISSEQPKTHLFSDNCCCRMQEWEVAIGEAASKLHGESHQLMNYSTVHLTDTCQSFWPWWIKHFLDLRHHARRFCLGAGLRALIVSLEYTNIRILYFYWHPVLGMSILSLQICPKSVKNMFLISPCL